MRLKTIFDFRSSKMLYSRERLPAENFSLPEKSIFFIKNYNQTIIPDIKIGDSIKSGEKILSKDGDVLLFSSVTGTVENIYDYKWIDGDEFIAISIDTSSEDNWLELFQGLDNPLDRKPDELLSLLVDAGFDIADFKSSTIDLVIVNCLESDLLVSNINNILDNNKENIKTGLSILKHITGKNKIILAIPEYLSDMAKEISNDISIVQPIYPNNMKDILIRTISKNGNCKDKIAVINIETLNAMVIALRTGRPFTEKIITLIGKGNKPQKNIKVRVGTPVSDILKANKIELEENDKVILGGAMRGKTIYDTDFPISIEIDAVLIQGKEDIIEIDNVSCVNCGKCVEVCPCNLQVNLLSRYSEFSLFEKCEELDIEYCIECGLCSYMCIRRRPVMQFLQFAKKEIEKLKKEEEIQ